MAWIPGFERPYWAPLGPEPQTSLSREMGKFSLLDALRRPGLPQTWLGESPTLLLRLRPQIAATPKQSMLESQSRGAIRFGVE